MRVIEYTGGELKGTSNNHGCGKSIFLLNGQIWRYEFHLTFAEKKWKILKSKQVIKKKYFQKKVNK